MAGEAQAFGKILDGLKELGKALAPEPTVKPQHADDPRIVINRNLLVDLRTAALDPEIWKHVPMGMARPVQELLDEAYPGWNK